MSKKIEVEIPGYGKRYCSDNVKFNIMYDYFYFYYFNKRRIKILHNEYGPALEHKNGSYSYCIDGKLHRLDGPAYYDVFSNKEDYYINDELIAKTKDEFIQYKNQYLLE